LPAAFTVEANVGEPEQLPSAGEKARKVIFPVGFAPFRSDAVAVTGAPTVLLVAPVATRVTVTVPTADDWLSESQASATGWLFVSPE
jgi:hypothetical protein